MDTEQMLEELSKTIINQRIGRSITFNENGRPKTKRSLLLFEDKEGVSLMMITTSAATWLTVFDGDDLIEAETVDSKEKLFSTAKSLLTKTIALFIRQQDEGEGKCLDI